jgi:hypothetical protein
MKFIDGLLFHPVAYVSLKQQRFFEDFPSLRFFLITLIQASCFKNPRLKGDFLK